MQKKEKKIRKDLVKDWKCHNSLNWCDTSKKLNQDFIALLLNSENRIESKYHGMPKS